jgi:hypothetical protein
MTPEETKAWVWARCHEDGDCLLWDGAVAKSGVATARDPNTLKVGPVRRTLMIALGRYIGGKLATVSCGNPLCMAEEHLLALTRKELQQRSAPKLSQNLVRSAKLAKAARAKSSMTEEKAREIRASGMRPIDASAHFDVPYQTAAKIIGGRAWKEYGANPFFGLGSRG